MKKNKLLMLALAMAVLLFGAGLLYDRLGQDVDSQQLAQPPQTPDPAPEQPEQPEEPSQYAAPDFTVYTAEGSPVKLSDFFGKPIVLNFWASWCGPCQSEMPDFDEAAAELEGQVQFLMINMTDGDRETVDIAAAFIKERGYKFPVYYDTGFEAAYTYGASALPTTFFIDKNGDLVTYAQGAIPRSVLDQGIAYITE